MTFTGADLIAQKLADLNVRHAFGIVSIHNMPVFDAINRLGKTRIIDVRHEQAGTHAADGYARASGEIGVMLASTGPGTSNTVTGLYEAQYASSRVLLVTGQAETAFYGKGLGYVHEAENQLPMLRTVARRVESPRHIGQLDEALNAVVTDMRTGRGAPGAVEVPIDLQYAESPPPTPVPDPIEFTPKAAGIEAVAERIAASQRRLIIAGGGVIAAGAAAELQGLAERLDAPVVTTVDGRGAIPEDHPLCIGNYLQSAGFHAAVKDADLSLAFGVRFAAGVDGQAAKLRPPGELVQVDIDPNIVGRAHPVALGVVGDARAALSGLLEGLDGAAPNDAQFNESVWEARDGLRKAMRARLGPDYAAIMDLMRDRLPRDGLLVRDSTIAAYNFGNQLFPIHAPRTSLKSRFGRHRSGPAPGARRGHCHRSEDHGDARRWRLHVPRHGTGHRCPVQRALGGVRIQRRRLRRAALAAAASLWPRQRNRSRHGRLCRHGREHGRSGPKRGQRQRVRIGVG